MIRSLRRAALAALVTAPLVTTAPAEAEPATVPGMFVNFAVLNTKYASVDYYSAPLELQLTGTGKCHLKVIFETRKGSLMYTRDVVVDLPAKYVTDYNMPPYGTLGVDEVSRKEYRVRVEPQLTSKQAPCAGIDRYKDLLTSCKSGTCRPYPDKAAGQGTSPAPSAPASGGGAPKLTFPPGMGSGPSYAPANGKLTSLQVPGGSFAVDEAQKLQVGGSGGCGFDLTISNKSYGGSFEQTWNVAPLTLSSNPVLYNGTHFGTLAEGSYAAKAVGKNGCTGSAQIDFKVTGPTSTGKVSGKPTISFDKPPINGTSFSAKKDSNIWFKVSVPKSVKDTQYATCCELEFDFKNAYGGWEALPNSPFQDTSFGLAVSQEAAVVPKSVSGYTSAREWRVKVKAYKYKTVFEWSDWLEFKVSPE